MGIKKLLSILGPHTSIEHTGTGEELSAADLIARVEANPEAFEASCDYTIVNGFIYRMDGNDSLARKPFGRIVAMGKVDPEHLSQLDEGGQLWRELKRLSAEV